MSDLPSNISQLGQKLKKRIWQQQRREINFFVASWVVLFFEVVAIRIMIGDRFSAGISFGANLLPVICPPFGCLIGIAISERSYKVVHDGQEARLPKQLNQMTDVDWRLLATRFRPQDCQTLLVPSIETTDELTLLRPIACTPTDPDLLLRVADSE